MISTAWANRILAPLAPTLQLHTGPPGPDGKLAVAEGVDRRTVTFTTPANGQVFNADAVLWIGVTRQERFTHFTAWDETGLLFTGTVSGEVVFAGDNVIVDPGQMTAFFNLVA